MKRARDRWNGHLIIGLFTVSFVFFPESDAIKATSLIFKPSTTTTTTTEATEYEEGVETEASVAAESTPATNYTGIPQLDYIYDPNLPRELNGYNLSSYPFLATVPPPNEIDFKCDGLHDGFYASVALKCQVYHQCIYGIRYDFLCANYTAFDQSTFICHFVSEVDCVNSQKHWGRNDALYKSQKETEAEKALNNTIKSNKNHVNADYDHVKLILSTGSTRHQKRRNDALYKATTTSTAAPPPTTTTTTTTTTTQKPPRRRPTRRRRPQYDYYDDDYYPTASDDEEYYEEDRGRRPYGGGRRRKRPRPVQRRPAYDEYEDDRYDRRQEGRTRFDEDDIKERRPYDRPRKTTKKPSEDRDRPDDRKPYDDDDRYFDRNRKNRPNDDKRNSEHDRRPYEDERRSYDRPRRPYRDDDRPSRDDESNLKEERPFREERPLRERPYRDERPSRDDERPIKNDRRPIKEEPTYPDEDKFYAEDKSNKNEESTPSSEVLVKPNGSSLYNKPRVPPRIARPVPKDEKEKYKYVTSTVKAPPAKPVSDEEYYDDYELEDPKTTAKTSYLRSRTESVEKDRYKPNAERAKPTPTTRSSARRPDSQDPRRPQFPEDDSYEDIDESRSRRLSPGGRGRETESRQSSRRRPTKVEEEYYYDEEDAAKTKDAPTRGSMKYDNDDERLHKKTDTNTKTTHRPFFQRNKPTEAVSTTVAPTRSETTPKDAEKNDQKSFVRVVKRPFLPSRGGSPYLPRGLQPLGGKNFTKATTTTTTSTTTLAPTTTKASTTTESIAQGDYSYDSDYDAKDDKSTYKDIGTSQEIVDKMPEQFAKDYEEKPYVNKQEEEKKLPVYKDTTQKYEIKEPPSSYFPAPDKIKYDQNFRHDSKSGILPQPNRYLNNNYDKNSDRIQNFKPSPQISNPYKPTNKPYISKIPENISIKQNLADSIENDYDVTLNDALNPTISNLPPIRSFPSPFIVPVERDYTFARFRNGYSDQNNNGNYNYQSRTPQNQGKYDSQRYSGQNYAKNDQISDSLGSASDLVNPHVVSVRTPQSFFIQPPRYSSSFSADETNSGLRPRHVTYRQVDLGDYA